MVSLESTTYPGTTEEELLPRITALGLEVGTDIFLVYSPEREDPGNPDFDTRTYGMKKLSDLVEALKRFESRKVGNSLQIRRLD